MGRPERKHPRAAWHHYNGATYFVTICTLLHSPYFGRIHHGEMVLSPIGQILHKQLQSLPSPSGDVQVLESVIMPNHIHLLVCIDNQLPSAVAPVAVTAPNVKRTPTRQGDERERLSVIISRLKSAVTYYARREGMDFCWQERFHDHIVRDMNEYTMIRDYIRGNPFRWCDDRYYREYSP